MAQQKYRRRRGRRMRRPHYRRPTETRPSRGLDLVAGWWRSLVHFLSKLFPKKEALRTGVIVPFLADPDPDLEFVPPLFSAFPELIGQIPWVSLRGCEVPSVPKKVSRAQHYFGNNHAYIKRESRDLDLISETQAKKLEFILGQVLTQNPDEIVYFGVVEDAWNLALAQACSVIGKPLRMYLVDEEDSAEEDLDLLGIRSLGVRLKILENEKSLSWWRSWEKRLAILPDELEDAVAALGYAGALFEIKAAVDRDEMASPDFVFCSVDSGAAFAGLEISRRLANFRQMTLVGVTSDESTRAKAQELVDLIERTWGLLKPKLKSVADEKFTDKDFELLALDSQDFDLANMVRWTSRFMELEGIELEHEWTAPALRKCCDFIQERNLDSKVVMFWNTYSGQKVFDLSGREFVEIKNRIRRKKFVPRAAQ